MADTALGAARRSAGDVEAGATWLLGAVFFAVYGCLCARAPYLLDSAEIAAAAFGLGVAHPPGEALTLLWGKLFCCLPVGPIAFRVGLSQAAAGGLAVAAAFRIALRLVAAAGGDDLGRAARLGLSGAAAVAFGLAPGVIVSANRPEVYALQTALSLGAVALALRAADERDGRPALWAALLVGLGFSNHPLVAALTAPGAIVAAAPALRGRRAAGAAAVGAAGLLVLVYVPMRTAALFASPGDAATIVWGDARTWRGLLWVLTAETFAEKAHVVHAVTDPFALPFAFMEELGVAAALLAPLGLWALARRARGRRPGLALALAGAGATAAALLGGFDPHNPDQRGYLGVAFAAAAVLAACGLAPFVALAAPRARVQVALAAAACALAATGARRLPVLDLRASEAAPALVADLLAAAPPRAVVLSSYFQTAFLMSYARAVEGARPDVLHVHLGFVRGPGYAQRLAAAEPELAAFLDLAAARPLERADVAALPRPALVEPDAHLGGSLAAALRPAGVLWSLAPLAPGAAPLSPGALQEAARDREARGFFAHRTFVDAELACAQGDLATTALRLGELARLVPADGRAAALARRCSK